MKIVLLSGGMKSATLAARLLMEGEKVHALTVNYGQPNKGEIKGARTIASSLSVLGDIEHEIERVSKPFQGSPYVGDTEQTVQDRPKNLVVGRNLLLMSIAINRAATLGADGIYVGVQQGDPGGYPDNRPVFWDRMKQIARLCIGDEFDAINLRVETPLLDGDYKEIWRQAHEINEESPQLNFVDLMVKHAVSGEDTTNVQAHPWGKGDPQDPANLLRATGYNQYMETV